SNVVKMNYREIDKEEFKNDFILMNKPTKSQIRYFNETGANINIIPFRRRNPLKYIIELHNFFRINSYDIVHVHGNSTTMAIELLIAKLHKVPVRIAHSHSTYTKYPIMNKILRPIFNSSY